MLTLIPHRGFSLDPSATLPLERAGTDFYPSAASDGETIVVTILVLCAAFLWTFVLAAFCDVATNGDPALTAFRQRLDGLNSYIAFNGVPPEMAGRMRSYMNQQRGMQLREELGQRALPNLSLALQMEVIQFVNRSWLEAVWFIRNLDAPVKVRLAMALQPKMLAPGEVAPNRNMYSLTRGSMTLGGRVLSKGAVWGDDVILANLQHCLPHHARAITYADVMFFSRQTLLDIVATYPSSMYSLRRNQGFLALRRALIAAARVARVQEKQGKRIRHPNGDFLDQVDAAAASMIISESQKKSMALALDEASRAANHAGPGVELAPLAVNTPSPAATFGQRGSHKMEARIDGMDVKIDGLCGEMRELKALIHSLVRQVGGQHDTTAIPRRMPHSPPAANAESKVVTAHVSGPEYTSAERSESSTERDEQGADAASDAAVSVSYASWAMSSLAAPLRRSTYGI